MPFVEANGARLYYEAFGEDAPGRPPIILIHGSTGTGQSNWRLVAPLLARSYRVIAFDCRGHGQSSNPNGTYSFKELAADTAALIRALGYERAHVVGHSNGGNVALVTLVDHPDVVQTAVIQAANAYVSQDLVEKEPAIFDPDRVAREEPNWMREMIDLHGATHGAEYWRDLLALTVREIISEPNYTPADLAAVRRPALVIQGENDRVNAPARHAQFIAAHIPNAELWIPKGIGHNVHDEALFAWVEKVLDFLRRRGDDANDALYRLRRARYAEPREWVFDLRAEPGANGSAMRLSGAVLTEAQREAARDLFSPAAVVDDVRVLLAETAPWALVNRAVTDLRREPRNTAERVSQALLGEPLRILETRGDWALVRLERDGYMGWTHLAALHRCERAEASAYAPAGNVLVVADLAPAYGAPPVSGNEPLVIGKLPFGVVVAMDDQRDGWASVRLPGGARWWCAASALLPVAERPRPDADGVARALALVRRLVGVPYLWGGRTPFGYDCSGLAQTFLSVLGIQAPRDADQQFREGAAVEGFLQPGDLLFFGEDREGQASAVPTVGERGISHVAIALGGDEFIHANGAAWSVSYNSFDPRSPIYRAWLKDNFVGARRFV